MPRPLLKLRLLFLLPMLPTLLAIATLTLLAVDHRLLFVDRPTLRLYYLGGTFSLVHTDLNDATGPTNDLVNPSDPNSSYKHFIEMNDWHMALPRTKWSCAGLRYESVPRVRASDPTNFIAQRTRTFGLHAEYLLALNAILFVVTFRHYRRARRRYTALTASYCPACGYDLRASPDRCPECGRPVTPDQHAPVPPVQSPEPTSR